jgi:hypothetical protein
MKVTMGRITCLKLGREQIDQMREGPSFNLDMQGMDGNSLEEILRNRLLFSRQSVRPLTFLVDIDTIHTHN